MATIMFMGILMAAYLAYLGLGVMMHYQVGYLDWTAPYWHLGLLPGEGAWPAFVIPGVLTVWIAYSWYQKSMIGEA